jgi:hypothetical protein
MTFRWKHIVYLLLAIVAALMSAHVQRFGPDQGIYCDIGKVNGIDVYCPKPKLNGGWPAPYLFDRPGISVEGKLAVIEDDFRHWPFIANISFYLIIIFLLEGLWQSAQRRRQPITKRNSV